MKTFGVTKLDHRALKESGDYYVNEILYCGKCNTPREMYSEYSKCIVEVTCECRQKAYEEKQRQIQLKNHYDNFIEFIDPAFRNIFFKDCEESELLKKLKRYFQSSKEMLEKNVGLFIYGSVGNGKTYQTSALMNELLKAGYKVASLNINDAIKKYNDKSQEFRNFRSSIQNVDFLFLDDFGISRETEYQIEQLHNLIDARYNSNKPLILTSNLSRGELASTDNLALKRIYDRIIGRTYGIISKGESYRMKKAQQEKKYIDSLLGGK